MSQPTGPAWNRALPPEKPQWLRNWIALHGVIIVWWDGFNGWWQLRKRGPGTMVVYTWQSWCGVNESQEDFLRRMAMTPPP